MLPILVEAIVELSPQLPQSEYSRRAGNVVAWLAYATHHIAIRFGTTKKPPGRERADRL